MKLKKLLQGSVFAAALGLCLATGIVAVEAATVTPSKTLTGLGQGDSVSFDAVKVKKGAAEYNLKAKWDLYEKADSSADLSKLSTKKDTYFAVKSSSGTDIYKVLADTQKKYKATCNGSEIKITVDGQDVTDLTKYAWRTDNTSWTAFGSTALDLTPYTMQGATLYIRYNGVTSITPADSKSEKVTVGNKEVTVKEIAANSFVAKEFKVKIPKKANAPAISVDYTKGIIKKNAKAVTKTATNMSGALSAKWSTSTMSEDFTINNSAAGVFMMQIPEDTAKNKPASKISFFEWEAGTAPTVTYTKPAISGTTISNKSGDLIANKLSYETKDNAKKDKATFEIKSKDADNTYEIYKAKTDGSPDGKAIATIKPNKTVVLKPSKVADNTECIIRVAGDKKAGTLPSPFATTKVTVVYFETPEADG